jgi:hypothetical protein
VVDVQFGLGQSGDEGVQVARDVGVDEVLGQGVPPRNGVPVPPVVRAGPVGRG